MSVANIKKPSYSVCLKKSTTLIKNFLKNNNYGLSIQPNSIQTKVDGSEVTFFDLEMSKIVKEQFLSEFPELNFFSEEDYSPQIVAPILVLDPIDGTRGFIRGTKECCFSLAILEDFSLDSPKNFAVLWDFFSDESLIFPNSTKIVTSSDFKGVVSRSEWNKGLFEPYQKADITPMGSIAKKLLHLSQGQFQYVVSMRPKNLWDIAAGTILAHQQGISFYSNGKKIEFLDQFSYEPPLVWVDAKNLKKIKSQFNFEIEEN